ncbi:MAG TPA: nucleoside-diphosphate kinase [Candidatus Nanoarchaeia archaeon]|nr:nucleoside-diphosphate kinase [Candidatus Nanoarchaeia archaeon]
MSLERYVERTVAVLKPDVAERGLESEVMKYFLRRGLDIKSFYTARLNFNQAAGHFRDPVGEKRRRYLSSGPVVPMLIEGPNAIQVVSRTVGNEDDPMNDKLGTIRGDLSCDSVGLANKELRAVRNLVDVPRRKEEVGQQIDFWFNKMLSGAYRSAFDLPPTDTEERTLVLLKPEVHERRFEPWVLERFHQLGVKIASMYKTQIPFEFARQHYADLAQRKGPDIADSVCKYLASGPITALVLQGRNAIMGIRGICGERSDPPANPFGTIRRDFSLDSIELSRSEGRSSVANVVHSSDSPEAAVREIALWFEYGLRDHTAKMLTPASR